MPSDLAQRNIERFNVTPYCANCDFWYQEEPWLGPIEEYPWRRLCRVNDFETYKTMACDEWELD